MLHYGLERLGIAQHARKRDSLSTIGTDIDDSLLFNLRLDALAERNEAVLVLRPPWGAGMTSEPANVIIRYGGRVMFEIENDPDRTAEPRALGLRWNAEDGDKAQWLFPCGCALDMDDGPSIYTGQCREGHLDC